MAKKYDVVARVGSYTDSSGQEKGKFENVGAVIENQNGGLNLLLKKTFNPAGLAEPGKESIILSLYEPEQKSASQAPQQSYQQPQQHQAPQQYAQAPQNRPAQQPAMNQRQPNPRQQPPVDDYAGQF